jgi:hypothetical protein
MVSQKMSSPEGGGGGGYGALLFFFLSMTRPSALKPKNHSNVILLKIGVKWFYRFSVFFLSLGS